MYKAIILALAPFFILSWLLCVNFVFEENEEPTFSQDFAEEKVISSTEKKTLTRKPAEVDINKNLSNELKKINKYENQERIIGKLYPFLLDESLDENKRFANLNDLHKDYLENKEDYDFSIIKILNNALNDENLEQVKRVYMLVSILPVNNERFLAQSETILYDLASGNIAWNQELYTYVLQFYYVQKKMHGDKDLTLGAELIDLVENSEIKHAMTRLNNELSK